MYLSNKDAQRLIQNKQSISSTSECCKNCHKSHHNTNNCKYSKRNVDTAQWCKPMKESDYKSHQETKQRNCVYCEKSGHTVDECFKKKNADARKSNQSTQSQPSISGNGRDWSAGIHPLRELKLIAKINNILTFETKLTNNHVSCGITQCITDVANLLVDTDSELNLIKLDSLKTIYWYQIQKPTTCKELMIN